MKLTVNLNNKRFEVEVEKKDKNRYLVRVGENKYEITIEEDSAVTKAFMIGDKKREFGVTNTGNLINIVLDGLLYEAEVLEEAELVIQKSVQVQEKKGYEIKAPVPGRIGSMFVKKGDKVSKNKPLLTLEAMKMENELVSPCEGVVEDVCVDAGSIVEKGKVLVILR